MKSSKAFTLIEMLVSVMLLGFVMMALYNSSDMLRTSNAHLYKYLQKSSKTTQTSEVLYLDILGSDGNITITKEDSFYRLIINSTTSSLYGRQNAKVAWLVYKENNALLRIEGGDFELPLAIEDRVDIDEVAQKMELFSIYRSKQNDKILVILKEASNDAKSFLVQNLNLANLSPTAQEANSTLPMQQSTNIIETPQDSTPIVGEGDNFITTEPNNSTNESFNQNSDTQTIPNDGSPNSMTKEPNQSNQSDGFSF